MCMTKFITISSIVHRSCQAYGSIRQKTLIKNICNVGMTQQWSLAKKDKKSDVGMVTG